MRTDHRHLPSLGDARTPPGHDPVSPSTLKFDIRRLQNAPLRTLPISRRLASSHPAGRAVDIWSVGYLIETSDVQWFDAGKRSAFKNELMHPDPTKRPTAMDAIRRLMELKKEYLQDEHSEYSEEEEKGLEDEDSAEEEDMQEENMPSEKCGVGEGDIPPSNKKQRIE
ncbi:hypothetical protein PF008_g8044 [Phytophthora fragariae]|uniref:Protein kinase domain-containing protein n=1 Tax=Phytophthora fragariae TaxID=53985 RepID=A0A6G0S292_9STRA|nr:hypothetical protein PF008_g8044 [Phytophthora fragariae]